MDESDTLVGLGTMTSSRNHGPPEPNWYLVPSVTDVEEGLRHAFHIIPLVYHILWFTLTRSTNINSNFQFGIYMDSYVLWMVNTECCTSAVRSKDQNKEYNLY